MCFMSSNPSPKLIVLYANAQSPSPQGEGSKSVDVLNMKMGEGLFIRLLTHVNCF
jgi:hypothetical protein